MAYPKPTNGVNTDYPTAIGAAIDGLNRRLKGNLLDNGAFQVWQRGTSIAGGGSTSSCGPDRWVFVRNGAAAGSTISQQAGDGARYCARAQRDAGNAATNAINLAQSIETANSIQYQGKTLSLQFRARKGADYSSASSVLGYIIRSGTGTDETVLAGFTGAADLASSSVTLTTSWQTFTIPAVTMGASATQLGVIFSFTPVGTAGAADYADIEEIQLVPGDYCGEFPYRSLAEELVICRRFARVEAFRIPATTAVSERINMRAVPTISGGGAGYTSTGTTADAIVHFQTTGAVAVLTLNADI